MALSNGQLPPFPSLEQSRNQARDLLRAYKAGDPDALSRLGRYHPRLAGVSNEQLREERVTLSDAQLVIAREAGLPTWARLKRQIDWITGPDRCRPFVRELSYYDDRAQGLLSVHSTGQRQALEAGTVWVDGEFFGGNPDFGKMLGEAYNTLSPEEQAFLDGPTEELCRMIDRYTVSRTRRVPEHDEFAMEASRPRFRPPCRPPLRRRAGPSPAPPPRLPRHCGRERTSWGGDA